MAMLPEDGMQVDEGSRVDLAELKGLNMGADNQERDTAQFRENQNQGQLDTNCFGLWMLVMRNTHRKQANNDKNKSAGSHVPNNQGHIGARKGNPHNKENLIGSRFEALAETHEEANVVHMDGHVEEIP